MIFHLWWFGKSWEDMVLQTHKLLVCWWPDWKGLAESSTLASVTSRLVFSLWPCKTPLEIFLAYLHVGLDYWNSPSHGTLIAWSPNSIRWVHRCQDFALSSIYHWFHDFFFIKVSFMKHPNVRAFEDIIDNVIMICINGLSLKKFLNFILIS